MSSKKLLKEAREAINNKDYQNCIKLCKEILKEDKTNYMALVFFGVSLQEVGPIEQAPNAFKKAIQVNQLNWIAHNGLANYYEKHGSVEEKQELFKIYKTIVDLDCNEKRIIECVSKLVKLGNENADDVVEYIQKLINYDCVTESGKNNIRVMLFNYLRTSANLSDNVILLFKQLLKFLVNNTQNNALDVHKEYIKLLYNTKEFELALKEATKSHDLYKSEECFVLWISKTYNRLFFDNSNFVKDYFDKVQGILCEHLIREDEINSDYLLSKCLFLYVNKQFQQCNDLLRKVVTLKQNSVYVWILKSKTELDLSLTNDALASALNSKEVIKNLKHTNDNVKLIIDTLLIEAFSYSDNNQDWNDAVHIFKKNTRLLNDTSTLISMIRIHINMNEIEAAKDIINKISDKEHQNEINVFRAQILKCERKYDDALAVLAKQMDNDWKSSLEAGNIYWELENFDKTIFLYLKAAKLNQSAYQVFLKLGQYYQTFEQLEKARRCFEKVIKLNHKCLVAAMELNKIYKIQENWDGSIAVLQPFIDSKPTLTNLWAWVELGITYYEKGDFADAINILRIVIRLNPNSRICWEALGDTYLARGAYTSSIKCYQKALELSPESLYPQIRIAAIQQILGQYVEAKEQYQAILVIDKLYIPALKGLAETYLGEAKEHQKNQLLGLAQDSAQMAMDMLSIAVVQDGKLSCVWKLLGDCCYLVACLSDQYCCLHVQEEVLEGGSEQNNQKKKYIEREEIFEFSIRCFSKAIVCIENDILIWHDLAKCLLSYAKANINPEKCSELYNKAFAAIHHCIVTNPSNWTHWNLMGVLAYFKEPKSYSLCQHAFIKATTLNKNSTIAWCNLGTLYLHLNEIKLANEAFSQAQRCDPNYINSWVGQALIAEFLGHEDCMDLFRHSTQLGCHGESEIGYAYWVCKTLLGEPTKESQYAVYNMHAIPVACDSLVWYTELHPEDACGWNMLGLLKERMGFKAGAMRAYKHSLVLTKSDDQRDKIFTNYGRSLIVNGKYEEAIERLNSVKIATFNSGSSLAYALFKNEKYEESYSSYESALHWLTDDNNKLQSDLLVALASMAYLFEGREAAKTLLFQSLKLQPPSPWGFYSTLSIGLAHRDLHLAQLVLNEMCVIKDKKEYLGHYSTLCAYFYLLKGDSKQAIYKLSKLVHRHPNEASLWLSFSILLIRLHKERPKDYAASQCARIAMELGRTNMDVTNVLCLVSLSFLLAGNYKKALKAAQKAVHYYPNISECWAILMSSLKVPQKKTTNQAKLVRSISSHIKRLKPSDRLLSWVSNQAN